MHAEVIVDHGLTDIVAERGDAGVRRGEQVTKDMIAVCTRARRRYPNYRTHRFTLGAIPAGYQVIPDG